MANILIIDDDESICMALCATVTSMGHHGSYARTLESGARQLRSDAPDVVFLDVRMPDGSGLDLLPKVQQLPDPPEVVVMTAAGEPAGAEIAISKGAWGYMEKPSSIRDIMAPLVRVLQYREEKKKRAQRSFKLEREGVIGSSPQMRACLELAAQAATSEANVLITGETGTGKEVIARVIHTNSPRREHAFVVVDCSALAETLAESTLFGHEKGAFTGAEKRYEGLVRQAHGGTLFLDEVGELSPALQKNFLRVLQEGCFRPLGGKEEMASNFRLIAATNRDLDQMVRDAVFREDLLFRIRTISMELAPLRERLEDLKELTTYYVHRFCRRYEMEPKRITAELLETLCAYRWPGNVRELRNVVEGVVLTTARFDSTLFPSHLPKHIRIQAAQACLKGDLVEFATRNVPLVSFTAGEGFPKLSDVMDQVKSQYFQALLTHTGADVEAAAKISGVSRSRLYAHLKRLKVPITR